MRFPEITLNGLIPTETVLAIIRIIAGISIIHCKLILMMITAGMLVTSINPEAPKTGIFGEGIEKPI